MELQRSLSQLHEEAEAARRAQQEEQVGGEGHRARAVADASQLRQRCWLRECLLPRVAAHMHLPLTAAPPGLGAPQAKRAEAEAQLAVAQADLRQMTEELVEAQVGAAQLPPLLRPLLLLAPTARPKLLRFASCCRCAAHRRTLRPLPAAQEAADSLLRQLEDDLQLAARSVEDATRQVCPCSCAHSAPAWAASSRQHSERLCIVAAGLLAAVQLWSLAGRAFNSC